MKNKQETDITTQDFTQGRFLVVFPHDAEQDEIEFIRNKLFSMLTRHGCQVTKKDDE
jgi:hypothetical protein